MTLGYGDGLYGDGRYGHPLPIDLSSAPVIPVVAPHEAPSPLHTNRVTKYRFDLLDTSGKKFGELDGVSSGSIDWKANSQVKGGGKITVAKSEDLHASSVRVVNNLPEVHGEGFETDTGGFVALTPPWEDWTTPLSIQRDTQTFHSGGASLRLEWREVVDKPVQGVGISVDGLEVGTTYTFVARFLNTTESNIALVTSGLRFSNVPIAPDWRTVTLTFEADSASMPLQVWADDPANASLTHVDDIRVYRGEAEGFNGESFHYAPFDWGHVRIRPVLEIEGVEETPLGVYIATAPATSWDGSGGRESIELLDRTSVLAQDYLPESYTVAAGTNIITAIKQLIRSTGEAVGSISDSDDVVPSTLTWGAGKNKLTVINELLDSAGYLALWSDGDGQYRVEKYVPPKDRPVVYQMLDDNDSIYLPDITVENDIYGTPNRVIMTSQGDGQEEGWTAVATNEDPSSPLSFQARGRWVSDIQLGIEAASQADLQDKANRRLASLISNHSTLDVNHGPIPGLRVNQVVRFRRKVAGVDSLFTVTGTKINFDPLELSTTTLTEIVNL